MNPDAYPFGRTEKGVFLADDGAVIVFQVKRNDLAWIWRGKGHPFLAGDKIGENGAKKAFTGNQSFTCTEKFVHQTR